MRAVLLFVIHPTVKFTVVLGDTDYQVLIPGCRMVVSSTETGISLLLSTVHYVGRRGHVLEAESGLYL